MSAGGARAVAWTCVALSFIAAPMPLLGYGALLAVELLACAHLRVAVRRPEWVQ